MGLYFGRRRHPTAGGAERDSFYTLTFADQGKRGVRIAEILARYRTGLDSMIMTTDIDATSAWSALAEKHPFLAAG